jgi:hypothetical protein
VTLEEWRTLFSGCTLISVLFVALNYWLARGKAKKDSELDHDKEICSQAVIALERAYETLTNGNGHKVVPEASRLNWITTSRQILRFKKLKSQLKTDLYKLVCTEHEEHWRHQFYLCFKHDDFISSAYYKGTDYLPSQENIDPRSALVIMNFKQWDPDTFDPLSEVKEQEYVADGVTLNGEHGLKNYIEVLNRA